MTPVRRAMAQSSYKRKALIGPSIRIDRELQKMNSTIYLSCLVVIIGSLAWTAQGSFESDSERVVKAFKNASPDSVSDSDVLSLVTFLDKYGDRIQLTPEQRAQANIIVGQYNAEKANQPLVDGVPPQGGWWAIKIGEKFLRKYGKQAVIHLGMEIGFNQVGNLFGW